MRLHGMFHSRVLRLLLKIPPALPNGFCTIGTFFVREQYTANVLSVPQTKTKSSKKCMKAKSGIFLVLPRVAVKHLLVKWLLTNCCAALSEDGRWTLFVIVPIIYRQTPFILKSIDKRFFKSNGDYFLFHRRTLFVIEVMVRQDKWGILLKNRCPQRMCHNFVKTIRKSLEKMKCKCRQGTRDMRVTRVYCTTQPSKVAHVNWYAFFVHYLYASHFGRLHLQSVPWAKGSVIFFSLWRTYLSQDVGSTTVLIYQCHRSLCSFGLLGSITRSRDRRS